MLTEFGKPVVQSCCEVQRKLSHIVARGLTRQSLYSKAGEVMVGTRGIAADEAAEFIRSCKADDRDGHGFATTEYTYTHGTVLTDVELFALEDAAQAVIG